MSFKVEEFRKSFPQLSRKAGPVDLVYFDSGASSLKHSDVTDRVNRFNRFETSNVHRGAHQVSRQGTESYEDARKLIQSFINAQAPSEVVFTRGTTESINFIAYCLSEQIQPGDEIVISSLEHHSNIVPWQELCRRRGAVLKVVPFDKNVGLALEDFEKILSPQTRLASFLMYSNSFGNRLPVEKMVELCRQRGVLTMVDAAQAVLTERIDVQKLGCDFLCFSGHKMFAPYGIGCLYIQSKFADGLPPYQTGGSMIDRVTFDKTTYANAPQKFEAGTPNVSGAIGLGEAVRVILNMGFEEQHKHVQELRQYLKNQLLMDSDIEVYDFSSTDHCGTVSFNLRSAHCSDVGTLLDKYGIAVRAGHHCTQPLMDLLGVPGTVRVSLAAYNTQQELEYFIETLRKVKDFF